MTKVSIPFSEVSTTDAYPTPINGTTAGWTSGESGLFERGHSSPYPLGSSYMVTLDYQTFRVDLHNGPGKYRMWLGVHSGDRTDRLSFKIVTDTGEVLSRSNGGVDVGNNMVLTATGDIITVDDYVSTDGGDYIEFTTSSQYVEVRQDGDRIWLSHIAIEDQYTPLTSATLSNEDGTGVHSGNVFPKEPGDKVIGALSSSSGLQEFTVVSGGEYYTTKRLNGTTYLVTTGSRVPDNNVSDVVVRQSNDVEDMDTTITLTASALDRPTDNSFLGRVTSKTYAKRNKVMSVIDSEMWGGYQGEPFATDVTVSSASELISAIDGIVTDGETWHRIALQEGDYSGSHSISTKTDFNKGGLLIEPADGHSPVVTCVIRGAERIRKAEIRDLTFVPPGDNFLNGGIDTSVGFYPIWKIYRNRIGAAYAPGVTEVTPGGRAPSFDFVEQFIAIDNECDGLDNAWFCQGGRIMYFYGNSHRRVPGDIHALTPAFRFWTPRGVFDDDETYAVIGGCTVWMSIDNLDQYAVDGPHSDFLQIRRMGGQFDYGEYASHSGRKWEVGDTAIVPETEMLYRVTDAPAGGGLADPDNYPTGTGSGIVLGETTWEYVESYPGLLTTFNVVMEHNACMIDGENRTQDGGKAPNIQFVINSNGQGNEAMIVALNNISASRNIRGIGAQGCEVHAEFNTFCAPAVLFVVGGNTFSLDKSFIHGDPCRAFRNITAEENGGARIASHSPYYSDGNVGVNFNSDDERYSPASLMRGDFVKNSAGTWHYPDFVDDDTISPSEMASALSKQLHYFDGSVGARLREVHTVSLSDGTATQTFDVVVDNS